MMKISSIIGICVFGLCQVMLLTKNLFQIISCVFRIVYGILIFLFNLGMKIGKIGMKMTMKIIMRKIKVGMIFTTAK